MRSAKEVRGSEKFVIMNTNSGGVFVFVFFFRQKLLIILRAETTIFNHCSDSCIYNLNPVLILGIGIEEPLAVSPGHTEMSGKLSMERLKVSEAWAGLAAHPF